MNLRVFYLTRRGISDGYLCFLENKNPVNSQPFVQLRIYRICALRISLRCALRINLKC